MCFKSIRDLCELEELLLLYSSCFYKTGMNRWHEKRDKILHANQKLLEGTDIHNPFDIDNSEMKWYYGVIQQNKVKRKAR